MESAQRAQGVQCIFITHNEIDTSKWVDWVDLKRFLRIWSVCWLKLKWMNECFRFGPETRVLRLADPNRTIIWTNSTRLTFDGYLWYLQILKHATHSRHCGFKLSFDGTYKLHRILIPSLILCLSFSFSLVDGFSLNLWWGFSLIVFFFAFLQMINLHDRIWGSWGAR